MLVTYRFTHFHLQDPKAVQVKAAVTTDYRGFRGSISRGCLVWHGQQLALVDACILFEDRSELLLETMVLANRLCEHAAEWKRTGKFVRMAISDS